MSNFKEIEMVLKNKTKIPKNGDVPKSEACGVYFLTKHTQRFWEDPQTPVTPDQSQKKRSGDFVILFYLRPWQSLRQNSNIPEILEEFLIQWAQKKEKNWRMNARAPILHYSDWFRFLEKKNGLGFRNMQEKLEKLAISLVFLQLKQQW